MQVAHAFRLARAVSLGTLAMLGACGGSVVGGDAAANDTAPGCPSAEPTQGGNCTDPGLNCSYVTPCHVSASCTCSVTNATWSCLNNCAGDP